MDDNDFKDINDVTSQALDPLSIIDEVFKEAKEEGFDRIAYLFEAVAKIEKEHEERYRKLLANIEEDIVFQKGDEIVWVCRNCGHIHVGKTAPTKCPVCDHPQAYFEERANNY